jgi:hypothetical protein
MAIEKLSALKTGLEIAAETQNNPGKNACEIGDKNRIKKWFISSQVFHRTPGGHIQEITAREQFEPRIIESFDPATQEL